MIQQKSWNPYKNAHKGKNSRKFNSEILGLNREFFNVLKQSQIDIRRSLVFTEWRKISLAGKVRQIKNGCVMTTPLRPRHISRHD